MTWSAPTDVEAFDPAAAWFRSRIPVTQEFSEALSDYAGPRAFTIAGVEQLEVVQDVFDSLAVAIEKNLPYEEWAAAVEDRLTKAWGLEDFEAEDRRMRNVFRNATQSAHNNGRWMQMQEPAVRRVRPFIKFVALRPTANPSAICDSWNGYVAPAENFPHDGHPPMHHSCQSHLEARTRAQALEDGLAPREVLLPQEGFGQEPTLAEWSPERANFNPALFDEYGFKRNELTKGTDRPRL